MAIYSNSKATVSFGQLYGPGLSKITLSYQSASSTTVFTKTVNVSNTSTTATQILNSTDLLSVLGFTRDHDNAKSVTMKLTAAPNVGNSVSTTIEVRAAAHLWYYNYRVTTFWKSCTTPQNEYHDFRTIPYDGAADMTFSLEGANASNYFTLDTNTGRLTPKGVVGSAKVRFIPAEGDTRYVPVKIIETPTLTGGTTTLLKGKSTTWTFTGPSTMYVPTTRSNKTSVATVSQPSVKSTASTTTTMTITGVAKGTAIIYAEQRDTNGKDASSRQSTLGYGSISRNITVVGDDQIGVSFGQTNVNAGATVSYTVTNVNGITLSAFTIDGGTSGSAGKVTTSKTPGTVKITATFKDSANNTISKSATITTKNITISVA